MADVWNVWCLKMYGAGLVGARICLADDEMGKAGFLAILFKNSTGIL